MKNIENIRKEGEDFLFALKNFETLFAKRLAPTEQNSVDEFFSTVSKDFVKTLREKIDFSAYKHFDKEMSFIEVDDEGQTRIFLAHKETLPFLNNNGIEIFIGKEININWFAEFHHHYTVIRNDSSADAIAEEKYEYSEIGQAVKDIKSTLDFPFKIVRTSWEGKTLRISAGNLASNDYLGAHLVRPIVFLKQLLFFWKSKETEVFYVDFGLEKEFEKIVSKKDILEKLELFVESKISRKELADWARDVIEDYRLLKTRFEFPDFDDVFVALSLADEADINKTHRKIGKTKSAKAKELKILFGEYGENFSKEEARAIMRRIKNGLL